MEILKERVAFGMEKKSLIPVIECLKETINNCLSGERSMDCTPVFLKAKSLSVVSTEHPRWNHNGARKNENGGP